MNARFNPQNQSAIDYNGGINQYLKDICSPLFEHYGISLFEYIKVFFDGTCLNISTNQDWLIHNYHFCPMGTKIQEHLSLVPIGSTRYIPYAFSEMDLKNPMLSECYNFDIWNGLYVYKRYEFECECFVFATNRSNTGIMNFYMNERPTLDKFIHYFKEKAGPFIDSIDSKKRTYLTEKIDFKATQADLKRYREQAFKPLFEPKKFQFVDGKDLFSLSKREAQCLCLLSYGKSAKEISNVLNLSPRTVEAHIGNLKIKTGSRYKSNLVDLFHKNTGMDEKISVFF